MPMTTRNQRPLFCSRSASCVTSSLTPTKRSYSRSSRVKSLTSSEPETESVSLMSWFISSFLACEAVSSS